MADGRLLDPRRGSRGQRHRVAPRLGARPLARTRPPGGRGGSRVVRDPSRAPARLDRGRGDARGRTARNRAQVRAGVPARDSDPLHRGVDHDQTPGVGKLLCAGTVTGPGSRRPVGSAARPARAVRVEAVAHRTGGSLPVVLSTRTTIAMIRMPCAASARWLAVVVARRWQPRSGHGRGPRLPARWRGGQLSG